MKNKIVIQKLREINSNKNYSQEASPYWEQLLKNAYFSEESYVKEPVRSNPDELTEDKGYFYQDDENTNSDNIRKMKKSLKRVLKTLTFNELKIVNMLASGKHTVRSIAKYLGISKSTVQHYVNKIRKLVVQNLKMDY